MQLDPPAEPLGRRAPARTCHDNRRNSLRQRRPYGPPRVAEDALAQVLDVRLGMRRALDALLRDARYRARRITRSTPARSPRQPATATPSPSPAGIREEPSEAEARNATGLSTRATTAIEARTAQVGTLPHSPSSNRKPGIEQVVTERISVSQPARAVSRSTPSASTTQNSPHRTAHCSHSNPVGVSWNRRMFVNPKPVAMTATHSEYQPMPPLLRPARLTTPT